MSSRPERAPRLEMWAGPECTVNRVGDRYLDQLERTGHARRLGDLELFAELGISAIRYPVLWERTAPRGLPTADWSWAKERLERLRALGIRPIVGLVHHGSGPASTSLLEPSFADGLSEYAEATARRFPWVEDWTPVNEPLTTARFSCLYGHWYPHARDDALFARALLNQCRAVVLAMRAIRRVNSRAQLVQTDDLGRAYSTEKLRYQADFENERRWLTWELLAGRVDAGHALWDWLRWVGVATSELEWFLGNSCPPDVVGINHYLTSDRFLDERIDRYAPDDRGGNGYDRYADVSAVRVLPGEPAGHLGVLREASQRLGLPLALTEVHNGCTREEQVRWLAEAWGAAERARRSGIDVRAVTAWSLLGAFGWDMLSRGNGEQYEVGVFDVRARRPRPTAIAQQIRALATGGSYDHPVLDGPGWWQRPDRLLHPGQTAPWHRDRADRAPRRPRRRPLLITGARGTLGQALGRAAAARGLEFRSLTRQDLDIAEGDSVCSVLDGARPWAVVNAAGYVRVDQAESERAACFRENATGPSVLARACADRAIQLLTFSSDLVFDGSLGRPYTEVDPVAPLQTYGASKVAAERLVLTELPSALVVRTSAFFGPSDPHNFVTTTLAALAAGGSVQAVGDSVVSPTYVPELVDRSLDLLIDGERGVWHLANGGSVTWAELATLAAAAMDLDPTAVSARPAAELGLAARRPRYSALSSDRGLVMASLEDALGRYAAEVGRQRD